MDEKHEKVALLWAEVCYNNTLVKKFFDVKSEKNLDKKIKVLTELKKGKAPEDIPEFYEILEKYPTDKNTAWGV